jgi:WXG100 family type VII secretion target
MSTNTSQLRDDGAILEGSSIVDQYKTTLLGEVSNLRGKIEGWSAQWQGQGAAAFNQLHTAWEQKVQDLFNSLDDFVQALKGTASQVEEAEQASARQMQNLMGGAGL